ncbi:MAG: hypothetical protein PWP64_251 [Candidatus Cloacimonadota bacterium]|nr:hypothetical protein [Candidatus Cloacimonadota bacterium]
MYTGKTLANRGRSCRAWMDYAPAEGPAAFSTLHKSWFGGLRLEIRPY